MEHLMTDAVIVINAGSSSLKFSVYAVASAAPELEVHGQIEGLGTAPHFVAKDRQGNVLADSRDAAASGHAEAFTHLVAWLRERFGAKLRPIAVGHRVVHGGA